MNKRARYWMTKKPVFKRGRIQSKIIGAKVFDNRARFIHLLQHLPRQTLRLQLPRDKRFHHFMGAVGLRTGLAHP